MKPVFEPVNCRFRSQCAYHFATFFFFFKQLSEMESAGTESIVFSYNVKDGTPHCFGTDKGMRFRSKRPDIFAHFMAFVTGNFIFLILKF
jgi:hypothetical protein